MQTLGATGAFNFGLTFFKDWFPRSQIFLPSPLLNVHERILKRTSVRRYGVYPYYDYKTNSLEVPNMLQFLKSVANESVVVLHANVHKPTGLNPTNKEWDSILEVCRAKSHIPFMLLNYQGLSSGNLTKDAYSVRKFLKEGMQMLVSQSYSFNMGIYGERMGSVSIVCPDADTLPMVMSQITRQARRYYTMPPLHGARTVARVLKNPANFDEWQKEIKKINERLVGLRKILKEKFTELKTPGKWDTLLQQGGPNAALGLTGKTFLLSVFRIAFKASGN